MIWWLRRFGDGNYPAGLRFVNASPAHLTHITGNEIDCRQVPVLGGMQKQRRLFKQFFRWRVGKLDENVK